MAKYEIVKNPNGSWTFFHPTGFFNRENPEEILQEMVKHLNWLYQRIKDIEQEYYEYTVLKGDADCDEVFVDDLNYAQDSDDLSY